MSVIPITLFFSLLLAGTFVVLFAREQRRRFSSAERDSLLPLAEETAREVGGEPEPDHDQADGGQCGCRRGVRTACASCLKRRDTQDPAYF